MIYLYDGTKEGFLTAFVTSFQDKNALLASSRIQLQIGAKPLIVETDFCVAKRAEERLTSFDRDCMHDLDRLLRSGDCDRDQTVLRYFRFLAEKKRSVWNMLSESAVIAAYECIQRVNIEIHRMKGFVRFTESASGALYAPISTDHEIFDLILPHFRARMPRFPFVIHDVKRKKAAVYDGQHTFIAPLDNAEILLSENELQWQSRWKKYFQSVNIPERERLKQQRGYLPVRYRKLMPEFQ